MTKFEQIIAKMPAKTAKAVLHQRELHSCLMELERAHILALQARCVYLNYQAGEGRALGTVPQHYERLDRRGNTVTVETYFRYINKVH